MSYSQFLRQGTSVLIASFTLLSVTGLASRLPIASIADSQGVLAQTSDEQVASRVYQRVNPSVVTIATGKGHGSGFVVSSDGLIVTNAHVLADAPSVVTVVFSDGRKVSADVIGFAKGGLDLAVLRVYKQRNLRPLSLASPSSIQVGYRVFAIGTPLEQKLQNTFTQGNISRVDKKQGIVQHTANISPGNSGGPLLNNQGQVIGVNTATRLGYVEDGEGHRIGLTPTTGVNFAISVDRIQSFLTAVRQRQLSTVSTLPSKENEVLPTQITLNGQVIKGKLKEGDRVRENGSYVNLYFFEGQAGSRVSLEMDSQEINPVLSLYQVKKGDNGSETVPIAESHEKGPGDLNAQIVTNLPEDGIYLVLASSSSANETGNYGLRATAKPEN